MDLFTLAAKLKLDSSDFESGVKKSEGLFSKLGNRLGSSAKKIAKIGSIAFASASAGVVAFAKSAVDTGKEFDSSMSQVAATMGLTMEDIKNNVNGAGDTFDKLSKKAREMGAKTNFSATQAAEGLNILAMSGYSAEQSMNMVEDVLHLAAAGSMDMASAASYISQSMKGFGDESKNSAYYADLMAKGATLANTNVQQLGEALGSTAAAGKTYGQSADSMTLSLLRLAEQGETGAAAGTALAATMKNLYAPTDQAAKAMKGLGVSAYNADGSARDLNDVVNDLEKSTKSLTAEQKAATLQQIFGIQGFNAYNKMVATSTKKQDEWKKALKGATGEAAKQYKTMTDNLQGDLDTFNSAVSELKISFTEKLMPTIRRFVQDGTKWIGRFTSAFKKDGLKGVSREIGSFLGDFSVKVAKYVPKLLESGWELIKALGKGIAKGIKNIKWPSWHDVKVYAKRAWEGIKEGIADFGGLIFGKNKKGQVKWPKWADVKKAAQTAWKTIRSEAEMLAARILSRFVPVTVTANTETGEEIINWPSWDDVKDAAEKAWNGIKEKVAAIADEFGGLVFGRAEDGSVDWPDPYKIGKSAHDWWVNEALPQINSGIDWLLGVTGLKDATGEDTLKMISGWWNDIIKPALGGMLDFTLGLFGLPSVSQMAQKVSDWWNNDVVNTAKTMITSLIPVDTANRLLDESLSGALTRIDAKVSTAQGLLDTLTNLGDASKLSSEKQDEWRKTADALIALFPQLSAVIDTDKMSISQNTDEIKKNIEEWANLAKERAIQDAKTKKLENLTNANTSLLEKQIELETKRNDLKGEQQKQIDAINKKLAEYGITATVTADNVNEVYNQLTNTLGTSEQYDDLWTAFAGGTTKVGALKTDIILLNAQIEANQKKLDSATADYKQWEAALSSLLNGTKSNVDTVGSALDSLAGKVNALPTTKTITINTVYKSSGGATDPTFKQPNVPQKFQQAAINAKGNWDVPYDNYAALLHRNEMVLTASQARQYREGQNGMNLGALAKTIVAAVKEGMKNAQVNAYMDGKEVTDNVSRRMANEFKAMRYAT